MALPEGMYRFTPPGQEELQKFISSAANQSVRPYSTNEEYLYAMKEDLAEWFKELYQVDIHVDNFIQFLENGILLCEHANSVNERAQEFREMRRGDPILKKIILPSKPVPYNRGRHASSFFSRDNVANFIDWCRKELLIAESVMFETNDLVLRKNEKNFILCLLEVARRGSKFGVPAPVLIQMEEEIDEEIQQDLRDERSEEEEEEEEVIEEVREPPKQKVPCDFKSLDEMVQYILGMCTCPTQFPMVKVSEGKYKVGDSKTLIFMRILRNHVMVRVGGGWDTLEHYLDKHDPCRCNRHKVEQKIATRSSLNVRQAAEGMNRASQSGTATSPRSPDSRKIKPEDWRNVRSQSLPSVNKKLSPQSSPGRTARPTTPRRSEVVTRSADDNNNNIVQCYDIETDVCTEHKISPLSRSRSPGPDRSSKTYSLTNNAGNRRQTKPQITVTETDGYNHNLNQTYPQDGNLQGDRSGQGSANFAPPRSSKTDRWNEHAPTGRSKTPTPSKSATSISRHLEQRRSVTPTPTITSQKRASLSVRSKSPDPDRMLSDTLQEKKRQSKSKGPPSSYRNAETLPRNYRSSVDISTTKQNTSTLKSRSATSLDRKSLQRPSSAMSYKSSDRDSDKKFTSTLSTPREHHRSMQDVRKSEVRPKSALASVSTMNLSTVPATKRTGRHTIATTNPMQRLSDKARSQSMDNLSIQKQLTNNNERNMFFERLSQPKTAPKSRSRSNLLDEDVLFVERKGQGTHIVQRDLSPRSESPASLRNSRSRDDHARLARESSTGSDTSTQSTQQQPSITPSDLRLRIRRDDGDKRSSRGQGSNTSSGSSSPLKDAPNPSNLRLSVSMTGSPESPVSRVSYSWTPDSGGDEAQSPSSGHSSSHTPKIIDRRNPHSESHLKPPPKRKVSKEEVLHVVRNPDGRHVWEHTESSIEQSQELIDLSPYKDQLSPSSQAAPHVRNNSSSSDSSVNMAVRNNPVTRVSKVQITLGKPRTSTPRRPTNSSELRVAENRQKNDVVSTSSSSIASSRSSLENNRRKGNVLQKTAVSDHVRSMLYTEDGRPKHSNSQNRPVTPRASTTPRPSQQRSSTPRSEPSPRRSQARPTTPRSQARPTTPRSRPKTPDGRRSALKRQEKLKDWDGPTKNRDNMEEMPLEVAVDRETRLLRAMEKELSENQKALAASGDSEDAHSVNESSDFSKQPVEYDYNGRRIRKKPNHRSKSPSPSVSNSRKNSSRIDRLSSCDSEATNRSFEAPESVADSEDFEVAMAMSGGPRKSAPTAYRSRSVDDLLDNNGSLPRPRKDEKHGSRKSRIPTPVHFNTGRKSVTGVPYHDSNVSKSAMRSNIEGVGSHELEKSPERNRGHRSSGSGEPDGGTREQRNADFQRNATRVNRIEQKENQKPSDARDENGNVEEYDLDGREYFEYGRYGNKSSNRQSRKSAQNARSDVNNNMPAYLQEDFIDGKAGYTRPPDGDKGTYVGGYPQNEIPVPNHLQSNYNYNANNNNSNSQQPIGYSQPHSQSEQEAEPVPPPRRKTCHRSTTADLLMPKEPANQQPRPQVHSNTPQQHKSLSRHRDTGATPNHVGSPNRGQNGAHHITQERNDSGIDVYTDPDSPGSSSAMSLRSTLNGDNSIGNKSGSSGQSVFSPDGTDGQKYTSPNVTQAAFQISRTQSSTAPSHDVIDTPTGRYYRASAGYQRMYTGYDDPRGEMQRSQPTSTISDAVYQRQTPHTGVSRGQTGGAPQISNGSHQNTPPTSYYRQGQNGYHPSKGPVPAQEQQSYHHGRRSNSSSSYRCSSTPPSGADNPSRLKQQSRHSPINEHGEHRSPNTSDYHRTPQHSDTSPRRRNFDDFFQDNRKLKESLNNLNTLYAVDHSTSGFQLENDDIGTIEGPGQGLRYTGLYRDEPGSMPQFTSHKGTGGTSRPPQYTSPPMYLDSSPSAYDTHRDSTIQKEQYASSGAGYARDTQRRPSDRYGSDARSTAHENTNSTPPAPPPRQKSSFRAVEKTKLDNLGPNYYAAVRKGSAEYAQRPQSSQAHYSPFQFANGFNLQQANDDQEAMYV